MNKNMFLVKYVNNNKDGDDDEEKKDPDALGMYHANSQSAKEFEIIPHQ